MQKNLQISSFTLPRTPNDKNYLSRIRNEHFDNNEIDSRAHRFVSIRTALERTRSRLQLKWRTINRAGTFLVAGTRNSSAAEEGHPWGP